MYSFSILAEVEIPYSIMLHFSIQHDSEFDICLTVKSRVLIGSICTKEKEAVTKNKTW
jgi:hypothetical protein